MFKFQLMKTYIPAVLCLLKNRSILLLFSSFFSAPVFAQSGDPGAWTMLTSQIRLHSKWGIHAEAQFRSYDIKPNTEQLLIRAGVNYHYNPNIIFTAGYGYILNFTDDGETFKSQSGDEHRIWQQVLLKSNTGRLFLEHRYRFEERFLHTATTDLYKSRIRYLLRASIPLNKKEMVKNTAFLSFYDEIFIHINNAPFDRNRLYGAAGFQFSSSLNIQAGYLIQTVGTRSKGFLQLAVNFNPDLRKKS